MPVPQQRTPIDQLNDQRATHVPPHDVDAEQSVLGAMLLAPEAIADAVELLSSADFYKPRHGLIFEAICAQWADGKPTDAVTIVARLVHEGQIGLAGDGSYIHELIHTVPTAANGGYYAGIVKSKATQRRLIEAGARITQYGYGTAVTDGDNDRLVELAEQALAEAVDTAVIGGVVEAGEYMTGVLDRLENDDAETGLSTGLADLDSLLSGMRAGQLIVIAGRPAMGKSVVGADIARHAALRESAPVLFCSLEMSGEELAERLVAAEAGANLAWFKGDGSVPDDQISKVVAAAGRIAGAPLFIDPGSDTTITKLRARARRLAAQHRSKGGLGLIVVDYLQLMPGAGRTESREREIAEISRGLKLLAKDLACPVVALAQLNRNNESRQDKRPLLSDLRESGAIEADADVVILLHREDYYDTASPRVGEIDLIVAKNRSGRCDTVTAAAQLHKSRIVSLATDRKE